MLPLFGIFCWFFKYPNVSVKNTLMNMDKLFVIQVSIISKYQWTMVSKYLWYSTFPCIQLSKHSWYPHIHGIQVSMVSKYPWYPSIQKKVLSTHPCLIPTPVLCLTTINDHHYRINIWLLLSYIFIHLMHHIFTIQLSKFQTIQFPTFQFRTFFIVELFNFKLFNFELFNLECFNCERFNFEHFNFEHFNSTTIKKPIFDK